MSGLQPPPSTAYREYLEGELASEGERSIHGILAQVARYGLLKFGIACFGAPFETARVLRQVQWGSSARDSDPEYERELLSEDLPTDFDPPQSQEARRREELELLSRSKGQLVGELYSRDGQLTSTPLPSDIVRDPSGYLRQKPIAPMVSSRWPLYLDKKYKGVWGTMGTISRRQGLFSLWQGVTTTWAHDILMDLGRATVEEAIESISVIQNLHIPNLNPVIQEEIVRPSLVAGIAEGIIGTVLAPLELVRIRLITQSVWPGERKYKGLWNALSIISAEEGGRRSLWRYPLLAFSTNLLKPLLKILPVSFVNYYWAPTGDTSLWLSTAWMGLQNLLLCAPLLITLPLETIRRRLLIQAIPSPFHNIDRPFVTRVKTFNPNLSGGDATPYTGALNCLWRMVREEGVGSLYQGWGVEVAAVMASFVTSLLAEYGEEDLGDDDEEL